MGALNHRKLREWRLASPFRAEEVCVRAEVSYTYLRAIEDGNRVNPSAPLLARIAAVYGHSVGELFDTDTDTEQAGVA
jgi:transcriptional regulator with XRE-family HTH domain